jgi:hypothetical protein
MGDSCGSNFRTLCPLLKILRREKNLQRVSLADHTRLVSAVEVASQSFLVSYEVTQSCSLKIRYTPVKNQRGLGFYLVVLGMQSRCWNDRVGLAES